jgi:hypothetical protein
MSDFASAAGWWIDRFICVDINLPSDLGGNSFNFEANFNTMSEVGTDNNFGTAFSPACWTRVSPKKIN